MTITESSIIDSINVKDSNHIEVRRKIELDASGLRMVKRAEARAPERSAGLRPAAAAPDRTCSE